MENHRAPNVRERIRYGDKEIEVEGPPEYVKRRIQELINQTELNEPNEASKTELLPQLSEGDSIFAPTDDDVFEAEFEDVGKENLIDYFLAKAPDNQRDQILVVTDYYQRILGYKHLSLVDYEEAFKALRRASVKQPSNFKSSVRNVVDRTDYLYCPERGVFALTLKGEQFVQSLNNKE